MHRCVLLGATGAIGRRVALDLVRDVDPADILLAGRDQGLLQRLGAASGAATRVVDVRDERALKDAVTGAAVVASCIGPAYRYETQVAHAAVEAGASYVSLSDDHGVVASVQALDAPARSAGVAVLSGAGVSPGISNALAALAAGGWDQVDHIDIMLATSAADSEGPAATDHLFHMFGQPTAYLAEGREVLEASSRAPRLVYFPEPVGWVETFRCAHPEIATLPRTFPSLTASSFRFGLTEKAAMDVTRAAVFAGVTKSPTIHERWVQLAHPIRGAIARIPPRGAAWTSVRVDIAGSTEGRSQAVSYAIVDHLSNLAASTFGFALRELLAGGADPGVRTPEEVMEPRALLGHLADVGIRTARLEPSRF